MTVKEQLEEEYKNKKITIQLFPEDKSIQFDDLQHFYDFVAKEKDFWAGCNGGKTNEIHSHFINIFNNTLNAFNQGNIDQGRNLLNTAISDANRNGFPAVYSVTSIGKFIRDRDTIQSAQADAACNYFFLNSMPQINSKSYFDGYLYSFFQGDSKNVIAEKLVMEEKALSDLRGRYIEELNALHAEYLKKHSEYDNNSKQLNEQYNTLVKSISDWKETEQQKLNSIIEEKQARFNTLEKTYEDSLRLKKPAEHWMTLSKEYKDSGYKWLLWAIASASLFILLLTLILYNFPSILNDKFSIGGLRGSIILALIVSIGIYIIRLFVKLSMSAYHLSRDAIERRQLTYVYLSLLHEKGVTEEDRNIVLQAIFSRADTGLLKGDSSPTLPTPLDHIKKNIGGYH